MSPPPNNCSFVKSHLFGTLKIVDEGLTSYDELVTVALKKTFRITDDVFLKDCHDTGKQAFLKECRLQLHYVNKKFRQRLRNCK